EVERQIEVLEGGGTVVQETRLYDPDRDETRAMRSKEEANDYRYFPDPDLLPVELDDAFIDALRATLPELPDARQARWVKDFALKPEDAAVLAADPAIASLYDALARESARPVAAANTLRTQLFALLADTGREPAAVNVPTCAALIRLAADGAIARSSAKELIEEFWASDAPVDVAAIIEQRGLKQISDTGAIGKIVDEVLAANPAQVEQYKAGNTKVLGFLVGQIMKASGGKANPAQVNGLLQGKLGG
ncbi:MAG: Asp-tRNA(Asn)/Glu-tRNA(Gln) amidotransferase GatCAB subunit B, partial [Gammaproteobacteria bacterium]|nr:Asp-tRNA(Asn)/Glu-tRNA(Gln) amidotransferase GatCAB subunit B [Gammaproteobacteria bacterium]